MLGTYTSRYLDRFAHLKKNLEGEVTKLRKLIIHVKFFRKNMADLKTNHKDLYNNEISELLTKSIHHLRQKEEEMRQEIYGSAETSPVPKETIRSNLIKAMKKYSRWRINELAERDGRIRKEMEEILRIRENGVISTSSGGERVRTWNKFFHRQEML